MEKKQMTIHRALSELKLIDARIDKSISNLEPCIPNQKGQKIAGYLTEEEFNKNAQADFQSINDLIKRKASIKSEIVASNAVTFVKIGGLDYRVADAIAFKTIVESRIKLANQLRSKLNQVTAAINKGNEQIKKNSDTILANALNGADNAMKADKTTIDNITKPYLDANIYYMVDPLKAQERIAELEKETDAFRSEVDAVLSESNAITLINI